MKPRLRNPRWQRGLTLMEVLVSMLVMALGMLGIAALQTTTMRYQLGSTQRSAISVLLADYSERVRSNLAQAPGVVQTGTSPYLVSGNWADLSTEDITGYTDCGDATVTCTAAQLAAYDLAVWRKAVREKLPNGAAVVSGSARTGMTVTFMWQDKEFSQRTTDSTTNTSVLGLRTSATCPSTPTTGIEQQACCPAAVAAPAGVRCANFTVTP
jgi:type IV pilus assembly protein PilV